MVFETHGSLSVEQVEAIEETHELLVNILEWDTHNFEVVPSGDGFTVNRL